MTFISNEQIYKEQQEIKKMLSELLQKNVEHSIEEISLSKTAKLLHLSTDSVTDLVKKGKLQARTYQDGNRRKRYRFRIADVREFQNENKYDHISLHVDEKDLESPEELANRIFPNRRKAI